MLYVHAEVAGASYILGRIRRLDKRVTDVYKASAISIPPVEVISRLHFVHGQKTGEAHKLKVIRWELEARLDLKMAATTETTKHKLCDELQR